MSGENLNASTGDIQSAAARIDGISSEIRGVVKRLGDEVAASAGYWAGTSQRSFDTTMAQWNSGAQKLNAVLDDISRRLRDSGVAYDVAEEENARANAASIPSLNVQ